MIDQTYSVPLTAEQIHIVTNALEAAIIDGRREGASKEKLFQLTSSLDALEEIKHNYMWD